MPKIFKRALPDLPVHRSVRAGLPIPGLPLEWKASEMEKARQELIEAFSPRCWTVQQKRALRNFLALFLKEV
jgi:hypothetical protein